MAIVETVLGPNTSMFATTGTAETAATMLAAVSAFIASKGWTVIDTAAPQTAQGFTVGHVFRTLQAGSTTVYKTVQVAFVHNGLNLTPFESWNATTHVGTNPYNFANTTGSLPQQTAGVTNPTGQAWSVEGMAVVVFAHPRWLAMRTRSNTNVYSPMMGSFEISKDYGEAASVQAGAYITTNTSSAYPSGNNAGFFGTPISVSNNVAVAGSAVGYNNVMTPIGMPTSSLTMAAITGSTVPNYAVTMTAVELTGVASSLGVKNVRGRFHGIKLISGTQSWGDMDTVSVAVDNDYFHTPGGTATSHFYINSGAKFLIPA